MQSDQLIVGTDGSCLTNPGFAGWAWVVDEHSWQAGSLAHATNQVAELSAIMMALQTLPPEIGVKIISDSQYAIKCSSVWITSWKRNGWRTASGGEVKNQLLIRNIDEALTIRKNAGAKTSFEWVRGHNGHTLNELADSKCGSAARAAREGAPDGTLHGPGLTTRPTAQPSLNLRDLPNW